MGIQDVISSIDGIARISVLRIDGPLSKPQHWDFAITHTPENLRLTSPLVPFEIRFSGGEVAYTAEQVRSSGVKIGFLDASFVSSSQIQGSTRPESATWRIDGSMDQATIDWLGTILPIPSHLQIKPPVDLAEVIVSWSRPHTLSIRGGLKTAGGVNLFADVTQSPAAWRIQQLRFSDGPSQAILSARGEANAVEFSFSGNVDKQTVDRLLRDNQTLSGRLKGNFQSRIDFATPLDSSFTGKLAGSGLTIHGRTRKPINLRQFAIDGHGNRIEIAPSTVYVGDRELKVDGTVTHLNRELTFDLQVAADRLDESLIEDLKPAGIQKSPGKSPPTSSTIVPRGTIRLQSAALNAAGFAWSPVKADILVDGDNTYVMIHEADLCGISTTGELSFTPEGFSLDISPNASNASMQQTIVCLGRKKIATDARYGLFGSLHMPPTRGKPLQSLSGRLNFSSENGRIYYHDVLMKILSILNITEMFTGGKSDLSENGYGYTRASAQAVIDDGKVQLQEILLDGHSLKITGQGSVDLSDKTVDITLLAAPLKTVDRIVDKLPIINYITGGTLISIPLRVHGTYHELKVVPMSPSAVGKGLMNIMKRTLKAPFKLVERAAGRNPGNSAGTTAPRDTSPLEGH